MFNYIFYSPEIANKMQQCIKIYYSMFIWSSTCFGRHTAHHQELKTAIAASGFAYVEGCRCWGCWMMGGVSPKTCWASYKHGIINFDTLLHLVGFYMWIILWCTDPRTSNILFSVYPLIYFPNFSNRFNWFHLHFKIKGIIGL